MNVAVASAIVIVVALMVGLGIAYRGRLLTWQARRIPPGTVLWAMVPYDDGSGQKDRPVLVLGSQGHSLAVLKLTTRDKAQRRDCLRLGASGWDVRGRSSWLDCGRVIHIDIRRVRGTGTRGAVTAKELSTARELVAKSSRHS